MKHLKKSICISICLLVLLVFSSCQKDTFLEVTDNEVSCNESQDVVGARNLFAQILSTALKDKDIREFIQKEALREIDNDYDVIYHYVKDEKLKNGLTFRENIAKYTKNTAYLDSITQKDMTLTILVPSLGDIFSVHTWNIENQVPLVAVRTANKQEKLITYGGKQNGLCLDRYIKPSFPVLVVKSNERLVNVYNSKLKSMSNSSLSNNDGVFAFFIDDAFSNKREPHVRTTTKDYLTSLFKEEIDALYNDKLHSSVLLNNICVRDYIYYNMSSSLNINKGQLDSDYRESIKSITFNNTSLLSHVNDKSDPSGDWSDGNLELVFDFLFVDRDGNPLEITKMASAKILDLFNNANNPTKTLKYTFSQPIDIFNWDMYTFGNIYKIVVSEYDPGTEIERTQAVSSTFGTNFEFSASGETGKKSTRLSIGPIKIGFKFGSSKTKSNQSTIKIKSTNNSDPLGDILVNYFDPLFINDNITLKVNIVHRQNFVIHDETRSFKRGDIIGVNNWIQSIVKKYENIPIGAIAYVGLIDQTVYENYDSNTGMVTLEIAPRYIYK